MEPNQPKMNERSLSRRLPAAAAAFLCLGLALTGCGGKSYSTSSGGTTDFKSVVFVGDSLTAGYQNGSLLDTQQPNGYAALIAKQAGFYFTQPLIAAPGAPSVLQLKSVSPLDIVTASGTTTGRDDITVTPTDVAVPGAFVTDVLNTYATPTPTNGQQEINTLVLGFPGLLTGTPYSQYSLTVSEKPTTVFAWIGNNDALIADEYSYPGAVTPVDTFQAEYTQTIGALAQTGAHVYVANIPDVTLVPFLVSGAEVIGQVAEETGLPTEEVGPILGLQNSDYINLETYADIPAIVECALGGTPCPLDNPGTLSQSDPGSCPSNLPSFTIPNTETTVTYCILHAADIEAIQNTVIAYNQVIDGVAEATGATVVDINTVFAQTAANGITENGYTGTFAFLGGIFGLDGVHPTNTGYGLLANTFISAINTAQGSNIAPVDLAAIAKTDPLWPTNLPGAVAAPRKLNGRYVGKLPSYKQARLIGDSVMRTVPKSALDRIAARYVAARHAIVR